MKTQRLRIAALILLAALCASACSTAPQTTGDGAPGEANSNVTTTTPPADGQTANTPAAQRFDGDPVPADEQEAAGKLKGQTFLVLIRKDGCADCDHLSLVMDRLRQGDAKKPFYILNLSQRGKADDDARVLQVTIENPDLNIDRTKNLPWAGVYEGIGTKAKLELSGVTGSEGLRDAEARLATALKRKPDGGGGELTEAQVNTLIDAKVAERLKGLEERLAGDANVQQKLLTHDSFKAGVKDLILADPDFRAALVAGLASDVKFQKQVKDGFIDWTTIAAIATLGLFPLMALALGAWNYRQLRRAALKPAHPPVPARRDRRTRVFGKALKSGKSLLEKLRSDVDAIEERVKKVESPNATDGSTGTRPEPDGEVRRTVLVTLKEIVDEAAGPTRNGEGDLKIKEAGVQLWSVIDGTVGKLRLELQPRVEALEANLKSHVESPHGAGGVTAREVDAKVDNLGLALKKKIDGGDNSLSEEIEKVRTELIGRIEDEVDNVRIDFGVASARGGVPVSVGENGHGPEAAGMPKPAGGVAHEETTPTPQPDARGPESPAAPEPEPPAVHAEDARLRDDLEDLRQRVGTLGALEHRVAKLEESPAQSPPGVAELKDEFASLRQQFQAEGAEGRRALEVKVESLEQQLRKSRVQMSKLWKRLRRILAGGARQTADSLRELREGLGNQLARQGADDEAARRDLEQRLQHLSDSGEVAHINLTNVTRATSQTVAEVVRRLLHAHEAKMAAGLPADGQGHAEAARALGWQRKQLEEAAAKVAPLVRHMTELTDLASSSLKLPPEIKVKLSEFLDDAASFSRLERAAGARLEELRSNSARSLYEMFRREREELERRLDGGQDIPEKFVNDGLKLLDDYAAGGDGQPAAPEAGLEMIKSYASGAEDRLMDWYSDFFQLHTRLLEARRARGPIDDAIFQGVAGALRVARDVLSCFDIQPEEIVIGQTLYDGRLHDFTQMRESSHPARTIIEVWKSGFHRLRNGETIRRPQVVVSGTGAVSGLT